MTQEENIKIDANRRGVPIIREQSHVILQDITKRVNPKHILEIGTAVGYSGLLMLNCCENADLITIEKEKDKVIEATENFKNAGYQDKVKVIHADCVEQISEMVASGNYDKYFDLVFLDGPKGQYINMLEGLIMLTKSGGTIIADNVLFRGYVQDKSIMPRRFKTIVKRLHMLFDAVENHPDIESHELLELEDGMLIIKVK